MITYSMFAMISFRELLLLVLGGVSAIIVIRIVRSLWRRD
jgi:hypothetical protein